METSKKSLQTKNRSATTPNRPNRPSNFVRSVYYDVHITNIALLAGHCTNVAIFLPIIKIFLCDRSPRLQPFPKPLVVVSFVSFTIYFILLRHLNTQNRRLKSTRHKILFRKKKLLPMVSMEGCGVGLLQLDRECQLQ